MSLVERAVEGFKAQFLSKLITAIAGGILVALLARLLQPQGYGLLMLALTVFSTFQLIARLGIAGSAGRYVAEFKESEPEQIPHIVRFSFLLNLGAIAITVLAVLVGYRYIVDLLGEPDLAPFLLLGTVFLAIGTVEVFCIKVLQGLESIRFVALLKAGKSASQLLFVLGAVLLGYGTIGAYAGYIISSALTAILGGVYLASRVGNYRVEYSEIKPGLRRRIAEYSAPLTATNSAVVLDKRIDTLLVAFYLTPVEVGFYVLGDRVVKLLETPMSALGFTLSPMFGSEKAAGNIPQISRLYETTLVNTLLLYIPTAAGLILIADPFVRLVFGAEYAGAIIVLQVLGVYVIFKAVTKLTDNGLNYLGRARERAIVRGATAVLNVILNIVLIPFVGVVGAAIATVITYGIYTAANLYIVSFELELRPSYLVNQVVSIVLVTAVMSAVVFQLVEYIDGWISLLLVIGAGGTVWLVLSVATGLLELRKIISTLA